MNSNIGTKKTVVVVDKTKTETSKPVDIGCVSFGTVFSGTLLDITSKFLLTINGVFDLLTYNPFASLVFAFVDNCSCHPLVTNYKELSATLVIDS